MDIFEPVAIAKADHDTNDSQFFIKLGPAISLHGAHTNRGQVLSGMDGVNEITRRDRKQSLTIILGKLVTFDQCQTERGLCIIRQSEMHL